MEDLLLNQQFIYFVVGFGLVVLFCCFFFLGIGFDFFFNTYLVGHEQDGNKYTKIF